MRHAAGRADLEHGAAQRRHLLEFGQQVLKEASHFIKRHRGREQHSEFVAAPARQKHARRNPHRELFGDGFQHPVSDQMAQRVIDVLEPVEIEQGDRYQLGLGRLHRLGKPAIEAGAVVETR